MKNGFLGSIFLDGTAHKQGTSTQAALTT